MIFGDGRTALQGSDQKYDLIISEPSNPWLAGVSNLFTKEFFHTAREHLTDDGVLAQWIQTYNFTISDYAMIVRTLRTEFPHYGVVILLTSADTVLLASKRPLLPDRADVRALQKVVDANQAISADLQHWFGGTDLRPLLIQNYVVGQEQLDRLVDREKDQRKTLNTDLHLRLEFDAPLRLFQKLPQSELASSGLRTALDEKWSRKLSARFGLDVKSLEYQVLTGEYMLRQAANPTLAAPLQKEDYLKRVAAHFETALVLDPKNAAAQRGLAHVRLLQERRHDAMAALKKLVELHPDDAAPHADFAQEYMNDKQFEPAATQFREALRLEEIEPGKLSLLWANNLAWILATNPSDKLRNGPEAVRWARAACQAADHKQPGLLDTLAAALAEAGEFDEAVKIARQAIELAKGQPRVVEQLNARIKLYEARQAFRE